MLSDITDYPDTGPLGQIHWTLQAEFNFSTSNYEDVDNDYKRTTLSNVSHDYLLFVIDNLSGKHIVHGINEYFTFTISTYVSSVDEVLLSEQINASYTSSFNFSTVKLPIYAYYMKSGAGSSTGAGYKCINGDSTRSASLRKESNNIGFHFKLQRSINFNSFENFMFSGKIYTGDYS